MNQLSRFISLHPYFKVPPDKMPHLKAILPEFAAKTRDETSNPQKGRRQKKKGRSLTEVTGDQPSPRLRLGRRVASNEIAGETPAATGTVERIEAALTKISVAFRFCFDDVGIGARAAAVVSTYPVVIQCIGSQSGHVAMGYIAYVQILVTGHVIDKISARGHV